MAPSDRQRIDALLEEITRLRRRINDLEMILIDPEGDLDA